VSDGGHFAIEIDGQSIFTDACGSLSPNQVKRTSGSGSYTAAKTGLVTLDLKNWRSGLETDSVHNYADNVRMTAQTFSFEAKTREINTYVGGTPQFELTAGPAYAGKWYIILQGVSGNDPGFDMNGHTVHVPLNLDAWTWVALDLNPFWTGFYSQLDANGEAAAVFNSFGDQPAAFALAIHFVYLVLENPGNTPVFASNPIYVLFTAP
jgi:hypothetical protein